MQRATGRNVLLFLALVSGLGGVVYEVLYLRQLTTVLGDMFYVHAGLLCMFLLGNGVGAWMAHRFLRQLWAFEIVIGLYAWLLPSLVPLYERSFLSHLFPNPVVQSLFASGLMLAVPSISIGFSIPLFSAYVRGRGEREDAFKLTYLLYNIGAAVSVVVVEFYLIRWIGVSASLYAVGLANLGCGVLLWSRRRAWIPSPEPGASDARVPWGTAAALGIASIGAALFLGFYIKVCYHLFLPHRENFAICTGASLLSIAIGTAIARRFRWRFESFLAGAAVSVGLLYAAFGPIAGLFSTLEQTTPSWLATARAFLFAFVLAVPYLFLGGTIPALLREETAVARRAGFLLMVSGVGNVVGMLLYIFLVHPGMHVFGAPLLVSGVLTVSALIYARPRLRWPALAMLATALPLAVWARAQAEESVYLIHDPAPPDATVTHYKRASDNVSFVEQRARSYISYNGHPSIHIESNGVVNRAEIVSGIIPALVAPSRNKALVLGLGSGITGGATATMFEHTDVVEINSAFFPLLDRIRRANFDVAVNRRATIIHDDARSFLASTDKRYDVIVNSIPSPTYFAAGKIYTLEFFRMVRRALVPGGVYCSWFAPVDMSHDGLQTFLATLATQFDHCNLAVLRNGYYFTSCSTEPVTLADPETVDFPAAVREALVGLRGVDLEEYFANIFVSDDILGELKVAGVPLNTDDFPIMEFQIMRRDRALARPWALPDPVVATPSRFNIDYGPGADPERFIARAAIFAQLHAPLFQRHYRPVLIGDPELAERYNRRITTER